MPEYVIVHRTEPCWEDVPAAVLQHTGWLPSSPIAAEAQACHNGETLFVRLEAREQPIRATYRAPLDPVSCDSCLEFFFAPLPEDTRYFNFELNPLGTLCLGFGAGRGTRVRQVVRDPEMFRIRSFRTETGWGVTFAVPGDFIRLYMPSYSCSGTACGNFYKCGDQAPVPHYLAWAPLHCDAPDFHRRQDFGLLCFE